MTEVAGAPKVVFFDVGDTLVRVDPSWGAIYARACREFGLAVVSYRRAALEEGSG